MNVKTARIVSFVFSTAALVMAGFYFFSSNREAMKPFMFVALGFILVSLVFRNLIRFKPEWFSNQQDNK